MEVRDWNGLRKFGINVLTGEADAYGLRLLCDLDEKGVKLVTKFLGAAPKLPENWNSGGVASIMLARSMFPDLAAFCLLDAGCTLVCEMHDGTFSGYTDERRAELDIDEILDDMRRDGTIRHVIQTKSGPRVGDRMVHAMSGRAA